MNKLICGISGNLEAESGDVLAPRVPGGSGDRHVIGRHLRCDAVTLVEMEANKSINYQGKIKETKKKKQKLEKEEKVALKHCNGTDGNQPFLSLASKLPCDLS